MGDVFGMRADAAEQAKHGLHEEGRLDQLAIGEMGEIVEMRDVVTFEFEARAVAVARLENVLDILEAVAEDEIARRLQMRLLPIEFEILVFGEQMVEAEIDRAHIERSDF